MLIQRQRGAVRLAVSYVHALQIHQLVEAQRWAVQAFSRMDMSKLISIVQDLNKDRQAAVTPSSPVEARCLLVRPCPWRSASCV